MISAKRAGSPATSSCFTAAVSWSPPLPRRSSTGRKPPRPGHSSRANFWFDGRKTPMKMLNRRLVIVAAASLAFGSCAYAQDKSIVVASTTSTQDSGLFGHILPMFKAKSGIDVKVVAQGTGQALDTARRGDADVVFVHAKPAEEKFLAEGFGVKRYPVMYNDFILIGPKADPAAIKNMTDVTEALKAIKAKDAPFISRGD